MSWEDEDTKEESGPVAVARALSGSDEAEAPDNMPDTTARSQPVAERGDDDDTAYQMAEYQPSSSAQPSESKAPSDDRDNGDQSLAALTSGAKPLQAPAPVVLKPMSSAPYEAAQELAQAKANFDPSKYKPSTWRRIGAALSGAAIAFGSKNPQLGMQAADEAMGAPLARAREIEAQKEAAIQQREQAAQLQNQQIQQENALSIQQGNLADRDFRNQGYVANQQAQAEDRAAQAAARRNAIVQFTPDDPKDPYSGGTGVTADGRTVKNVAPPDKWLANWERDPKNKAAAEAAAGVQRLQRMKAAGIKLTPEQEAIVASGGKVTPAVHTNINIRENPDGSAVTPKTAKIPQALQDRIVSQKNQQMQRAQQQLSSGAIDAETAQAAMQDAQDNFEQRVEQLTGQPQPHLTIGKDFKWSGGNQQQKLAQQQQQPARPAQTSSQPAQAQPNGKVVSLQRAMSLPANKGKTADQVKADIQAHGYKVGK